MELESDKKMEFLKYAKIALAVLLLLCLFHWSYGYYTFIRIAMTIVFAIMAVDYLFIRKKLTLGLVSIGVAILFNPICKVVLGRAMWNVADVVVAVLLIGMVVEEGRLFNGLNEK